jgi:hypothetical protein
MFLNILFCIQVNHIQFWWFVFFHSLQKQLVILIPIFGTIRLVCGILAHQWCKFCYGFVSKIQFLFFSQFLQGCSDSSGYILYLLFVRFQFGSVIIWCLETIHFKNSYHWNTKPDNHFQPSFTSVYSGLFCIKWWSCFWYPICLHGFDWWKLLVSFDWLKNVLFLGDLCGSFDFRSPKFQYLIRGHIGQFFHFTLSHLLWTQGGKQFISIQTIRFRHFPFQGFHCI